MAKKHALGRGLGAILPESDQQQSEEGSGIYKLPENAAARRVVDLELDYIVPNPYQPRDHFDEASLAELADSIREHGLIQPITVRKTGRDSFEIISGERRLRAARMIGLESLPAYVREADSEEMLEWALIENIQREDLDPIEQAQGFQRLTDECGLTQSEVAEKVGKDRSTVANSLRLLKLPPSIQKALRRGELTAGHARVLVSIEEPEVREQLFTDIVTKDLTVRAAERLARKRPKKSRSETEATPTAPDRESLQIRSITDQLRSKLGTQVAIRHKSGEGGEIHISYYSPDDLERVVELLLDGE